MLALALLLAVLASLIEYAPSGFSEEAGIGLKVKAKPARIEPGSETTLEIELRNTNTDRNLSVVVTGKSFESVIVFAESFNQDYGSAPIRIGPEGTRKISLAVKTKPEALEGKYPIDVMAMEEGQVEGPKSRVFLEIEKK